LCHTATLQIGVSPPRLRDVSGGEHQVCGRRGRTRGLGLDVHTILTRDGAAALHEATCPISVGVPRVATRLPRHCIAAALITVLIALAAGADRWLRFTTLESIPAAPATTAKLFRDPIALSITVSAGHYRAPWVTTDKELRESVELWKRMHLTDWNEIPEPLRAEGLDRMLRRYDHLLNNPSAWDTMDVFDWDAVPQPIRTVAYRRMVGYWSGFYDVGAAFDLPAPAVAETLAAVVMSESWFDHRSRSANRDGTVDVGLAQASPFARQRLRELHASGRVDAALSENEYYNPWMATRFVALWMNLMLVESRGDLELAVRAYNRGSAKAMDQHGTEYLAAVKRRLARFIRNRDAPPSWDYVWRRS
jgi:hypothetical protein